ncbi:diguanylate cyclase domain-containing protein [Streptomyces sp. NPDC058086]|uniref:diguanylate cyclase domain-containing protein n=1 Tax=Streptomyces sp. NPDC058086 TaxID=3346334 RepID=UPI0036E4D13C
MEAPSSMPDHLVRAESNDQNKRRTPTAWTARGAPLSCPPRGARTGAIMPATTVLRPRSRTLIIAAAVPLALAALLADDMRVRRQLDAARKDPLTGLPGRDALTHRVERLARTHREQLHVLIADADGLKTVNDSLGHAAGDALIAAIGHRLGAWAAARGGLAARLGGDEMRRRSPAAAHRNAPGDSVAARAAGAARRPQRAHPAPGGVHRHGPRRRPARRSRRFPSSARRGHGHVPRQDP